MSAKTPEKSIEGIFARNLISLIGDRHTVTSLSRDLNIHRNQIQRFVDGVSFPKPDALQRICQFFDVDARIMTHRVEDLRGNNNSLPGFLMDAVEPVPQDLFPDGLYEEWRALDSASPLFVCEIFLVKTLNGVRHTKVILNDLVMAPDGSPKALDGLRICRGVALRQAGGLCIIDRSDKDTGLTFTALRFGIYGDADLFAGHKRSVRSVVGSGLLRKSATVLRRLRGGYREAMFLRRQPRFRTPEETPELIQWLLKEQQSTVEFG